MIELGWISAIRKLADDINIRRNMANAAIERARDFIWSEVAGRRRRQVLDILSNREESVRGHQEGLQSFRSMRRMDARRKNVSALRHCRLDRRLAKDWENLNRSTA